LTTDPETRVRFPALPEKKLMGLERGLLSLVSTTEELLDGKVAAPVYKTENTAVGIRHADHVAPSIRKKFAITSPTSGGRSVGIVSSRTQTMVFFFSICKNVTAATNTQATVEELLQSVLPILCVSYHRKADDQFSERIVAECLSVYLPPTTDDR
jgi:hypothetical protein